MDYEPGRPVIRERRQAGLLRLEVPAEVDELLAQPSLSLIGHSQGSCYEE